MMLWCMRLSMGMELGFGRRCEHGGRGDDATGGEQGFAGGQEHDHLLGLREHVWVSDEGEWEFSYVCDNKSEDFSNRFEALQTNKKR